MPSIVGQPTNLRLLGIPKGSERDDFLSTDDHLLLHQFFFEPVAHGSPELWRELRSHHLDQRDVVALDLAVAAPEALPG